jgi:carboxymethylenebutenolidase
MLKPAALAILLALAVAAPAQDWAKKRLEASPRHQEWVDLKNGTRTVKAFVVYPEKKDKAGVVVLIHEIMGLTDWVMGVADQLAEHGYIAIAPDFLSGMGPDGGRTTSFADVGKAREAISALPPAQVTGDLNAACDYAKKIPASNGKVAVGGFCWGGSQTFRFATDRPDLWHAFVFYGTGPSDPPAIARIKAPVHGFYGANDNRVNATIPETERLMREAKKAYDLIIYPGAGHGFMRSGEQPDAEEANRKARAAAWRRLLQLLGKPGA